jgi:alpha-N-arabinofuranosidase
MANIAQTINVLQAVVLTQGEKMILTPTYHVFEMYKVHQDATLLPVDLKCADYASGEDKIPVLNASASKDKEGKTHISLCNLDPKNAVKLECDLRGTQAKKVSGRVLTAATMQAHNTFENPNAVQPADFKDFQLKKDKVNVTLPARSVVVLEIE